ncbi:amidohydrolase [Microtetraspora sp. NBRC 13810]|nr:amidohydrolase [Microtetraspora sp. NBRC 13810]
MLAALAVVFPMTPTPYSPPALADRVSGAAVKKHLEALQSIATAAGGNRAAGTRGYEASADYVIEQLRQAGYQVRSQVFTFPYFRESSPPVLRTGGSSHLVSTLKYSGSGDVRGTATPVPGQGCAVGDYRTVARGSVALVQRGTCSFEDKARLAQSAGAGAMILVNNDGEPPHATLEKPGVRIPVVAVGRSTGSRVSGRQVRVRVKAESGSRTTRNVFAETQGGDPNRVVMLGAHLDSVQEGPGINDNGSGAGALLEIARQLAATSARTSNGQVAPLGTAVSNRVRFAWWGAEELGLLGSKHYVQHLSSAEKKSIALYLNFDMIASKNFTYGIYDGDDSDKDGAGPGPEGSGAIEKAFQDFYRKRGLPFTGTDFTGRSDYGPFIEAGIPAGGLFTGSETVKTPAEARLFGGTAGVAKDACYHKSCDTITNINDTALDVNSDAIATVLSKFATRLPRRR